MKPMADYMITTMDNPFNPFKDLLAWYNYDVNVACYGTWSMLAAEYASSSKVDDDIVEAEIEEVINEFLERNPLGIHVKVYDYEADTLIPLLNKVFKEYQDKLAIN